ncbi:hypothetical protein FXW78_49730 [Rhodococcus opacus]|nr:hypothetical protein [Rhodococcus opacus]
MAARIVGLPNRVCAAFVVGLAPSAASGLRNAVAGDRPGLLVVTEVDAATAALAAATVTSLRRRGVPPRAGRVVLTHPTRHRCWGRC